MFTTLKSAKGLPIMADGDSLRDTLSIEDINEILADQAVLVGSRVGRLGRPAVSEQVWNDDTVSLFLEVVGKVPPVPGCRGEAVTEEEGRPLPLCFGKVVMVVEPTRGLQVSVESGVHGWLTVRKQEGCATATSRLQVEDVLIPCPGLQLAALRP